MYYRSEQLYDGLLTRGLFVILYSTNPFSTWAATIKFSSLHKRNKAINLQPQG